MHNVSEEIAGLYQLSPTRVNEKTDPQGSVLSFRVRISGRTRIEHIWCEAVYSGSIMQSMSRKMTGSRTA